MHRKRWSFSVSIRTFYCKILWNCEAARLVFWIIVSPCYQDADLACSRAIGHFWIQISRLRLFARFNDRTHPVMDSVNERVHIFLNDDVNCTFMNKPLWNLDDFFSQQNTFEILSAKYRPFCSGPDLSSASFRIVKCMWKIALLVLCGDSLLEHSSLVCANVSETHDQLQCGAVITRSTFSKILIMDTP